MTQTQHLTTNFDQIQLQMERIKATNTHGEFGLTLTDETGNSMQIDIPASEGGTGQGMRPMQTLLAALIGCSSVDVVSILKKQRQTWTAFRMEAAGERVPEQDYKLWRDVHLNLWLEGEADPLKVYRAAALSVNKYCSVAETLRRAGATITFSVFVNDALVSPPHPSDT